MVENLANLAFIVILIFVARSRRNHCSWNSKLTMQRLIWGIVIIVVVQVGGLIKLLTMGTSIGILGTIQWIGVYWVAAAIFRRRDLQLANQQKIVEVQTPPSPPWGINQKRLYVLVTVAVWTSLVVLVGLAEPFNPSCCVGDWSTDLLYKVNNLGEMFMFGLALPVILIGAILFWWYGKT